MGNRFWVRTERRPHCRVNTIISVLGYDDAVVSETEVETYDIPQHEIRKTPIPRATPQLKRRSVNRGRHWNRKTTF